MPNVLRPFWRLIVLFCKFYGIFAFHSAKIYVTRPPSISEKKIAGSNFSCTFMHSTLKKRNKLQKNVHTIQEYGLLNPSSSTDKIDIFKTVQKNIDKKK